MLNNTETNTCNQLSEALLAEHRPVLFRYSLLQLKDNELADDAAQESLLAAWKASANFQGNASLRTWLIGILKHKIADYWQLSAHEVVTADVDQIDSAHDETDEDDSFISDGHWNNGSSSWNAPEAALKQQEFWAIYETCQNNLPPKMAKVFMLRELVGLETEEGLPGNGLKRRQLLSHHAPCPIKAA